MKIKILLILALAVSLPAAAQTTPSYLPNTGGTLTGPLTVPLFTGKLPRVDVTHSSFGSGCANAADPTGTNDSTCAIEAAVTFASASAQRPGGDAPALYFPHGIYKISGDPRIPCGLHIIGDGPNASIIEETNNTEGFSIINGEYQPDYWDCNGSMEGIAFYAPNGHLYTATQLQILGVSGYTLRDVRAAGGGGRGIALLGSTERTKAYHIEIDTVRWPLLWGGNENHLWGLNIATPGMSADNYCYSVNCINGVFPSTSWNGGTLVSANGNGTAASFYVHGSSNAGTSPILAGNYFQVSGTTGTVLDATYQATSITQNVTSDPSGTCSATYVCFEVQGASAVSGTATVTGASWLPALLPDRTAAVWFSGANTEIEGGSIKILQYTGGIEAQGVYGSRIASIYFEGYPIDGQPRENSDIVEGGLPQQTTLTQALPASTASTSATVASTLWFHYFVNDTTDENSLTTNYRIVPQDFLHGSTAASAYVPGVERGQFENVDGTMLGNGTVYLNTRNASGSTAPASTAWPSGSIIAEYDNSENYGTLKIEANHLNGLSQPGSGSNWAADCVDNSPLVCATFIGGTIPNGITSFTTGQAAGNAGVQANVTFDNDEWWAGSGEVYGESWIKARGRGVDVLVIGAPPGSMPGVGYSATLGSFGSYPAFVSVEEADGSYPYTDFQTSWGAYFGGAGVFTQLLNNYGDPITGNNPGMSYNPGRQFATAWCDYDVPASAGAHSLNRVCFKGSPGNTGSSAGFEYDTWSGSAWVSAFSVNGNGTVQANGATLLPTLTGTTGSIGGSAVTAGNCATGTATVTNATTSMVAKASPNTYPGSAFTWDAQVTAANTVTVYVCTNLAAGATPTASTYNVRVSQ